MRYKKIEGAEKLKSFISPMLAQPTDRAPFDDPDWVFEIKWDGYRAIAEVSSKGCRLYSRNGLSFAGAYKPVFDSLSKIKKELILDGEIVVFDKDGKPSFQKLQNYASHSKDFICYYVFDLLSVDGKDVTGLPLLKRKEMLKKHLPKSEIIRYCDHIVEEGVSLFREITKQNLEGIIAKKAASTYQKGKRTPSWLKLRNIRSEEAIIVGFTAPKGSRKGFGSLLLAQYIRNKLTFIGNVGTGFNGKMLDDLHRKFSAISRKNSPLDIPVKVPAGTTWVAPTYVCNVKYTEKTSEGILRHPVFQHLRVDKKPGEVKAQA